MADMDPMTEKRLFSLGVNNRYLSPARFWQKTTPQDDRIPRLGGPYMERELMFPDFLKVLEEEREKMESREYKPKTTLTTLPLEIIYSICDYLPAASINALTLVGNRTLTSFTQRILYAEFDPMRWFISQPKDKFQEYPSHPRAHLWKEWCLQTYWYYHNYKDKAEEKIIQDMSKLSGIERLVLKPGFEYEEDEDIVKEFLAQDYEIKLADRLGEVMLRNITTMIFCVTNPNSVRGILKHMKKLTRLLLYFDSCKPPAAKGIYAKYPDWNTMIGYIGEEVGQTLRYLAIDIQHKDLEPAKNPFASLGSREKWPHLEILRFGMAFFAQPPEDKLPNTEKSLRLMRLLKQVCDASVEHGGWTINRLVDGLNPFQFALLSVEETKKMVNWLNICKWNKQHTATDKARPSMNYHLLVAGADLDSLEKRQGHEPWSGHIYINDILFEAYTLRDDKNALPEALKTVIDNFSAAGLPLKLELQIERPYWKDNRNNVREKLWGLLIRNLDSLHLHPTPCVPADFQAEQDAIDDWIHFMDEFLPQLHNLSSFRIQGARDQMAPIFTLPKHAKVLHELNLNHKLRHLDIDFGALMQPGTFLDYSSENPRQLGADVQEPRMVMHQVMWLSMPDNPEDPSNVFRLENLESLILRNMFVYREIEVTWVGNITAKLKNLERLELIGLVWAVGYDPDEGKRSKWAELDKDIEDREIEELEGSGWVDSDSDDDNGTGGDGGGVLKGKISLTGDSDAEPEDSGSKKKSKGKKKNKKKSKSKGKAWTQNGDDSSEGDNAEDDIADEEDEKEKAPSQPPSLEDEEPIKWFEPKDGDYARYNLERVPSRDEEAEAEKRKKRNKKKAESKKRKRMEKKLAELHATGGDDAEEGLGVLEGSSRSGHASPDESDDESSVSPEDTSTTIGVPGANATTNEATPPVPIDTSSIVRDAGKPQDPDTPPPKPKKKKTKGKKAAANSTTTNQSHHPLLPPTVCDDNDPDAVKKTRALVQSIETQFTKFNLGENNELAHPTPHHDDGLLAWLPHKDDPTSSSSSSGSSDENSDSAGSNSGGNNSNDDSGDDFEASSDISTLFGSDPRYPRDVNIRFRNLRHRDWLIRVLLETAQKTGGKCRDVRILGMKLNGRGQKCWAFELGYDADLDPNGDESSSGWDGDYDEDMEWEYEWDEDDEDDDDEEVEYVADWEL